jgi:hypothetical protein
MPTYSSVAKKNLSNKNLSRTSKPALKDIFISVLNIFKTEVLDLRSKGRFGWQSMGETK